MLKLGIGYIIYTFVVVFLHDSCYFIVIQSITILPYIVKNAVRGKRCAFILVYHIGIFMSTIFIYPVNLIKLTKYLK